MSDYGCCTLSQCVCPESAIGKCYECCYYDKNFFIEEAENGWWVFTFGSGQKNAGYYVKIKGTFEEARAKMIKKYGREWAFQYSWSNWIRMLNDPNRLFPMEEEMEVIK